MGIKLDYAENKMLDDIFQEFKNHSSNHENTQKSDSAFQIMKADDDKRLVFGWALVSATSDGNQIIDHQGDIVDQDELEQGAYDYVLNFRDAGEEHISSLRKKARMVESVVFTEEKLEAMGIPQGTVPYGWWIGFYVDDDTTWELIKNGTYKMFSIEGRAIREPVNEPLAKSGSETVAKTFSELMKFNPYHDSLGRFASAGGATSFSARNWQMVGRDEKKRAFDERSSGGGTKAIKIESPDGTRLSYRVHSNGAVTEIDGVVPKNTNGMTLDQLSERAKSMGWKVTTYDDNQLKEHDAQRAKDKKETDDFLNRAWYTAAPRPRKGMKGH